MDQPTPMASLAGCSFQFFNLILKHWKKVMMVALYVFDFMESLMCFVPRYTAPSPSADLGGYLPCPVIPPSR